MLGAQFDWSLDLDEGLERSLAERAEEVLALGLRMATICLA